tara:strand:+ start:97 stop:315 length:219 start_codon:yes stop_codon:yes gene_type:complete
MWQKNKTGTRRNWRKCCMEFDRVIMLRETTKQSNKINHYFVDIFLRMFILIIVSDALVASDWEQEPNPSQSL